MQLQKHHGVSAFQSGLGCLLRGGVPGSGASRMKGPMPSSANTCRMAVESAPFMVNSAGMLGPGVFQGSSGFCGRPVISLKMKNDVFKQKDVIGCLGT